MTVAAVDIGTNSVRLLVLDSGGTELERVVTVVGLGRGVDESGSLAEAAIDRTIQELRRFKGRVDELGVSELRVIATSASRDASNREEFFDRVEVALGVRPDVISGDEEAVLTFVGAVAGAESRSPYLVIDIGGGSTEFAIGVERPDYAVSVDIGSVRLTERLLPNRPSSVDELSSARGYVDGLLDPVRLPIDPGSVIGVGGTFTSLAAIANDLDRYDRSRVHRTRLGASKLSELIATLRRLSVSATAEIPSLDPARAPVLLAGAVIAERALTAVGAAEVIVSESDLLDAAAAGLLSVA